MDITFRWDDPGVNDWSFQLSREFVEVEQRSRQG